MDVDLRGWAWFDMNGLTPIQLQRMRERLTIRPRATYRDDDKVPSVIQMYVEDYENGRFGVPRAFFTTVAKRPHTYHDRMAHGMGIDVQSAWQAIGPFAEQDVAVRKVVKTLAKPPHGALIQAGCGFGKTATALEVARRLGGTTLVLVHKEFLMNQWRDRILGRPEQTFEWEGEMVTRPAQMGFWPDAKVGFVRGDTCDYEGMDIVIAMVQSLASRTYDPHLYRWARTVITDEAHRIGAATWAPVMPQFISKYRIALTATPRRKDGADNVFWWHVGPVAYVAKSKQMPFKVRRVFTQYEFSRSAPDAIVLSAMSKNDLRNRVIVDELRQAVDAGRKVLVLGERLNMLEAVWCGIKKQLPDAKVGLYTGSWFEDSSDEDRKLPSKKRKRRLVGEVEKLYAEGCQVIFATKQTAEEGLDIWDLDALFLITPLSDVEQAVGRIRRWPPKPELEKFLPLVVDFVDAVTFAQRKATTRMHWYRQQGAIPPETS
jgi:hypothetical protein